jgi:hypothetical protein
VELAQQGRQVVGTILAIGIHHDDGVAGHMLVDV